MTRRDDDALPRNVIEDASTWMFRVHMAPEDVGVHDELAAWLAADPTHARAWALAGRTWALTGQIQPAASRRSSNVRALWTRRLRQWRPQPIRRRHARRAAIPAVAAMVALFLFAPTLSLWLRADFMTTAGVTRSVRLEDGSQLVLAADTALSQHFSASERHVEMLHGEAWFDVAHHGQRPFVVSAGDMRVTVTGTAFDVAMTERTLSVALARGAVRVERSGTPTVMRTLRPGEWLDIDRASGDATLKAVSQEAIGAWRSGRIAVQDAHIADVVDALDRQYRGRIFLSGNSLGSHKVTGVYDLNDPVRGLRALVEPYGGRVRQITPWVILLSDS
jgi:transmembrane sensor